MSFSEILKKLRTEKGLTQEDLAKLTGLKRSAIGMYESGSREPKFEVLELLADFFNVDMNTLLDRPNTNDNLAVLDDPEVRMLARKAFDNNPEKAKLLKRLIYSALEDDEDD